MKKSSAVSISVEATEKVPEICPFYPMNKYLLFASIFGAFPLSYRAETRDFCFRKSSYCSAAVIIVGSFLIYSTEIIIIKSVNGISPFGENVTKGLESRGADAVDSIAIASVWLFHLFGFLTYFWIYKRSIADINILGSKICALSDQGLLTKGQLQNVFLSTEKKYFVHIVLGFGTCIASGLVNGFTYKELLKTSTCFYSLIALRTILTAFIILCPTATVTFVILDHILGSEVKIVDNYLSRIKCLNSLNGDEIMTLNDDDTEDRKDFISAGHSIDSMVSCTEKALGLLIFNNMTVSFVSQVFGAFFGIMLFAVFTKETFSPLMFLFGLTFSLLGLISFLSIVFVTHKGQVLTEALKKCADILDALTFAEATCHSFSEVELRKVTYLAQKWKRPAAIRPCDSFNLNRATTLSLYGLLTTYIIVLLQFKFTV